MKVLNTYEPTILEEEPPFSFGYWGFYELQTSWTHHPIEGSRTSLKCVVVFDKKFFHGTQVPIVYFLN